jgi:hypothetical protein
MNGKNSIPAHIVDRLPAEGYITNPEILKAVGS